MHSLRFAQWSEARLWDVGLRLGYLYRRDVSEFHPADRVVTHSSPPSETRTPIATHETTISQVHEIPIGAWKHLTLAPRWRLTAGADVSPIVIARLTTILPEKYPGQEIVFQARVASLATRVQVLWQRGRWPIAFSMIYGRTWSYQSSNQFSRDSLQFGVRLSVQP